MMRGLGVTELSFWTAYGGYGAVKKEKLGRRAGGIARQAAGMGD